MHAFNRTIEELKACRDGARVPDHYTFNRTIEELKDGNFISICWRLTSFNRTIEELKVTARRRRMKTW